LPPQLRTTKRYKSAALAGAVGCVLLDTLFRRGHPLIKRSKKKTPKIWKEIFECVYRLPAEDRSRMSRNSSIVFLSLALRTTKLFAESDIRFYTLSASSGELRFAGKKSFFCIRKGTTREYDFSIDSVAGC
jgi:hypothetical protein